MHAALTNQIADILHFNDNHSVSQKKCVRLDKERF